MQITILTLLRLFAVLNIAIHLYHATRLGFVRLFITICNLQVFFTDHGDVVLVVLCQATVFTFCHLVFAVTLDLVLFWLLDLVLLLWSGNGAWSRCLWYGIMAALVPYTVSPSRWLFSLTLRFSLGGNFLFVITTGGCIFVTALAALDFVLLDWLHLTAFSFLGLGVWVHFSPLVKLNIK